MSPPSSSDSSFIGRGFPWPLVVDGSGSLRLSHGAEDLDQSILLVMMTAPGERLMRPKFGCRIWEMLFEPVTPTLIGRVNQAVRVALAQWEPRITVDSVVSTHDDDEPGMLRITVDYTVRATNDRRNLVYPFYVIPHDAE